MDDKSQTEGPDQRSATGHQAHEQRLAAALRDLVHQVDIGDYRDSHGHPMRNNLALLKAQAVVDEFGVTHEQLCRTLDDCDLEGDLADAARKIFELREAKPTSTPPEYKTWQTGP
jgi:hypothetical protein